MVPHYQPCLLVGCLAIGHACWSVATATNIFTSQVQMDEGCLQRCHYISRCHSQICLFVQCNSIRLACLVIYSDVHVCKVKLIRQGIWSVTNSSDMPIGRVTLPLVCKNHRLPSWTPFRIQQMLSDERVASLRCKMNDACNSRIRLLLGILNANP